MGNPNLNLVGDDTCFMCGTREITCLPRHAQNYGETQFGYICVKCGAYPCRDKVLRAMSVVVVDEFHKQTAGQN